jgi:hypothetical protein
MSWLSVLDPSLHNGQNRVALLASDPQNGQTWFYTLLTSDPFLQMAPYGLIMYSLLIFLPDFHKVGISLPIQGQNPLPLLFYLLFCLIRFKTVSVN